jgi:GH24 family phage-related lysozyme (muramidase)
LSYGHIHDAGHDLCQGDRPKAILEWPGTAPASFFIRGNPIEVPLDDDGKSVIRYIPPSILDSHNNQYYVSGVDKIIATLSSDASTKDDTKTVTTKVSGLAPMPGSASAGSVDVSCPKSSKDGYVVRQTNNHGCLYYGTEFTNKKMQKIAHQYVDRQTGCAHAWIPRTASACDVSPANSNQKSFVTMPSTSTADPMAILAMSLPWDGFHDMGPEPNIGLSLGNALLWNLPFAGLEDGYDGIIDIRDMIFLGDSARLNILRDTILDNHGQLPYPTEGGDPAQAPTDFHAHFVPNEQADFSISCLDGPRGPPDRTGNGAIAAVCTIESFGGFTDQIDLSCAPTNDNTRRSQPLTCNFDPASVTAAKDFFTTANLRVSIPIDKPLAQYTLSITARAHNQNIQHTTTVILTCGLCLPPTERSQFQPMHVSAAGYGFTKDKESFNMRPGNGLHGDCSATVTRNCHVTHDRYGLYQDGGTRTSATGFCTRGIGIADYYDNSNPPQHRACNQQDVDAYHAQWGANGQNYNRAAAENEQHQAEDAKANIVNGMLKVQLTQPEFDAVVDYTYNHGEGNFARFLEPTINSGHCDTLTISADWRHPGPIDGRLAQQLNMFINGVYPHRAPANQQ